MAWKWNYSHLLPRSEKQIVSQLVSSWLCPDLSSKVGWSTGAAFIHARHREHPHRPCGTSQSSRWSSCSWLQRALITYQPLWGMFQRVGFTLGCQKELGSSPGRPEESELCRVNEPLVLSLGLTKPQPKGGPPRTSIACRTHQKRYIYLLQFLNSELSGNSWKPQDTSLYLCGQWLHGAFGWQIAEQGPGAVAMGFQPGRRFPAQGQMLSLCGKLFVGFLLVFLRRRDCRTVARSS